MGRPGLIRGLRIAWSLWWGILCVLLVVLWVRSYTHWDSPYGPFFGERMIQFNSLRGRFFVGIDDLDPGQYWPWTWRDYGVAHFTDDGATSDSVEWEFNWTIGALGFGAVNTDNLTSVLMPHWLLAFLAAAIAAVPWLRWSFSLRTLLIATTLIAVLMGLVVLKWH